MANEAIESASDEGMAVESGIATESGIIAESRDTALGAYGEDDDVATQLVEPLHSEPRWLVRLTPFDRRTMETTTLVSEVLAGRLAPSTQVWRDGMRDWTPIERLLDLPVRPSGVRPVDGGAYGNGPARGAETAPRANADRHGVGAALAVSARSPALAGPVFWLVNAAFALAVAAATLGVLTAGGVFE